MKTLYWFQNDLRLQDNPGLLAQAGSEQLLLVYCWREFRPWCNLRGLGAQRQRFLVETLQALREELADLGQQLVIVNGDPESEIPALVQRHHIDRVATAHTHGYYEQQTLAALERLMPVPVDVFDSNSLYDRDDLGSLLDDLPRHFTPFRKQVEALPLKPPRSKLPSA